MVCKNCGSKRVFALRIDSDWGYGIGDYYPVNEPENYDPKELKFDATDRPDIDLYHCRACGALWE